MIKADLVNPRSLSQTVRNDINTELWMRYVCLSPAIREALCYGSPKAATLYKDHDLKARLSFLAMTATLANIAPAMLFKSIPMLVAGIMAFGLFLWFEAVKKQLLISLSQELVPTLYPDAPPKGTFFQFGEDLARKYPVTSFVDFNGNLEHLLKRFFITLFPVTILIYIDISWPTVLCLFILTFAWSFFIRPVRILRVILRLR